jgi:hypothetical protein
VHDEFANASRGNGHPVLVVLKLSWDPDFHRPHPTPKEPMWIPKQPELSRKLGAGTRAAEDQPRRQRSRPLSRA